MFIICDISECHFVIIIYFPESVHAEEVKETDVDIRLSAEDVKKYESQFAGSVIQYERLQLKEAVGQGLMFIIS